MLMTWYREHARELPWRGVHDPYATWLSEIMLQQTRVATVIDRYGEFLRRFPTLGDLAAAQEDDVLALWSGLGYYRRARMLHRGAQFVVRELDGHLPSTAAELRTLPGIGEYTAAAIGSIAFGERIAVVDGNVERVLLRVLGRAEDRSAAGRARIHATAQSLVPATDAQRKGRDGSDGAASNPPGDHNQAMMELGATICLPRAPLCLHCPVVSLCRTRGEHSTKPRSEPQSRQAAYLLAVRKRGLVTEVLLERRAAEASLMPGMLELPPLPLSAVEEREPVLRLRHGITNTNYLVRVYSEGAQHIASLEDEEEDSFDLPPLQQDLLPFRKARPGQLGDTAGTGFAAMDAETAEAPLVRLTPLLPEIPAAPETLLWVPIRRLSELPLTGLTRKCLQRLGLMAAEVRHRH